MSKGTFDGSYGTHPLDKYDPQATEPEFSEHSCAYCNEDMQLGAEVWRYEDEEMSGKEYVCCSIGCLAFFTANYDVDIDEFEYVVLEK